MPTENAASTDDAFAPSLSPASVETTYPTPEARAMPGHWFNLALSKILELTVYPKNLFD